MREPVPVCPRCKSALTKRDATHYVCYACGGSVWIKEDVNEYLVTREQRAAVTGKDKRGGKMIPEHRPAYIQAMCVAATAEIEAMKALNAEREAHAFAPAYDADAFFDIVRRYALDHNSVVAFLEGDTNEKADRSPDVPGVGDSSPGR